MTTTVSRVLLANSSGDEDRRLLRNWCEIVAEEGGSFSIDHVFDLSWFMVVTINWPDGMKPERLPG